MIKGVIFDMDGVLVDSEEFICEAACRMYDEMGHKVEPEDFLDFVGTGEDRYIGGVAEKYGIELDIKQAKKRTYDIYLDIIKGKLKPLNGVREFINLCKDKGLRLAVASSADRRKVDGNLEEIGLRQSEFDAVICGEDVERKKPAPDIFLLAAEKIGLPANECVVVEDAVSGVAAAKDAGARCLALKSSFDDKQLARADVICDDLAEALTQADKIFGQL
jgi:HAD superfamily hydrolase (TIGR01509 family)